MWPGQKILTCFLATVLSCYVNIAKWRLILCCIFVKWCWFLCLENCQ